MAGASLISHCIGDECSIIDIDLAATKPRSASSSDSKTGLSCEMLIEFVKKKKQNKTMQLINKIAKERGI
jgi:hypothetical protein